MEKIHRYALRILAEVGMTIDHPEALEYLRSYGCQVDMDAAAVRFPEEVTQGAVDRMREAFRSRAEPASMAVRYSHVRFRSEAFRVHSDFTVNTGGYCVFIYDLAGNRRLATLEDTRHTLRLAHHLDQITYTGLPVSAQDVPLPIRQITMAAELVKTTPKLGGIEALNPFDVEYICRIGDVVRGSREALKREPILVGYAEARSPLTLDRNMCDVYLAYLRAGMPQSLDTMPNAGSTAPMHPAATLAMGLAETLAGVCLAYAVDPHACVTIDVTPSFADMRTGAFKYAGSERASLLGARIQMIGEYYGCPSGVHGGKTDSCFPDMRTGVEKGVTMLMPILCGAVGFGTVGHLENAVTFSPAQLVIDNEVARYVRGVIAGFEVPDEAFDIEAMKRVGTGGHYLEEQQTVSQFREWLDLSPFFDAEPWGRARSAEPSREWNAMAVARARELMSTETPSPLTPDQHREIDAIVEEATHRLGEEGRL
jgi:trimethylamine--corrinoid protein Co-methyltransferase